jgi:hypothetical protein
VGQAGRRRAVGGRRGSWFRGTVDDRLEYGATAEFEESHDCDCGPREFAMADRAALRPKDSRHLERRDTRQLCRGGHPFQLTRPHFTKGKFSLLPPLVESARAPICARGHVRLFIRGPPVRLTPHGCQRREKGQAAKIVLDMRNVARYGTG